MFLPNRDCATLFGLVFSALALIHAADAADGAPRKPLWLAVAKSDLAEPLTPLTDLRRRDGFEVVVSTKDVQEALRDAPYRPDFLLLVGDDQPGKENSAWYLPSKRLKLYRWRSVQRPEYASDAAWGDLDGSGVPVIPVGRIPARSRAEVELVVRKTIAFESQRPKASDLNMPFWMGSPEYTPAINTMASGLGVAMIQTKGPPWLRPWFVSSNANDPLCGWPANQPLRFDRQMKQGGVLGVLMGHANSDAFYSMSFRGNQIWYTAKDARAEFSEGPPTPPLVFFTCESGNFTQATPCLAKSLLFLPGGPVAAIGATTESHPLTNYFSSTSLLAAMGKRENRLGTIWLAAQREARRSHDFLMEMMLRDVEGSLERQIDQEKLRRDQVLMYAILGDPATRLRLPEALPATVERTARGWRWRAKKPPGATSLEVGFRNSQFAPKLPQGNPSAEAMDKAADAANDCFAFSLQSSPAHDEPWEGTCDQTGWLRLVAIAPNTLYVAVLKLD